MPGAPGGPVSRPARDASGDRGAVVVETAVSLLAVVLLLGALVWFLVVLDVQLRAGDAARAAARLAARGQPDADVRDEARRIAPGSEVLVSRRSTGEGVLLVVEVRRRVEAPSGPLPSWGGLTLVGRAGVLQEEP